MARRDRSDIICGMCGSTHYRDVDEKEWARCVECGIHHGGYCYPYFGATVDEW